MKVELINYQYNALEILLLTKSTRLKGTTLEDIMDMSMKEKLEHFEYMKDTIKSSFEFCTYIFGISGVSRAFTQQLERTRTQSYAEQSLRAVDVRSSPTYNFGLCDDYDSAVTNSMAAYEKMVDSGIPIQEARGVLPIDITTNIIVGTNLRTLHETAKVRLCFRTQGEYQEVFKKMKECIRYVHPWAADMLNVACVDSGICCFPRYTECPIQASTVKVSVHKKLAIKILWEQTNHVANPIAKNGVTV
jgi:thymidylate synthase ThyX